MGLHRKFCCRCREAGGLFRSFATFMSLDAPRCDAGLFSDELLVNVMAHSQHAIAARKVQVKLKR